MHLFLVICVSVFSITIAISQIVSYRDPKRVCEMGDADCFKKVCPTRANEVYDPCSPHCQLQCEMVMRPCKLLCMPGCACKPGYCRLGPLHYARSKCVSLEAYSGGDFTTDNVTTVNVSTVNVPVVNDPPTTLPTDAGAPKDESFLSVESGNDKQENDTTLK